MGFFFVGVVLWGVWGFFLVGFYRYLLRLASSIIAGLFSYVINLWRQTKKYAAGALFVFLLKIVRVVL